MSEGTDPSKEFELDTFAQQQAKDLVQEELCDSCLGRLFGKVGLGYTNEFRGQAIRQLFPDEAKEPVDYDDCAICQGLMGEIEEIADLVKKEAEPYEYSTFLVGCKVDPEVSDVEEEYWTRFSLQHAEPIKAEFNRLLGKNLEKTLGKTVEFDAPELTFVVDTRFNEVRLTIKPLFIYGRYRKLERGIPQTKWFCRKCRGRGCDYCKGTGKMYEDSVEELIARHVMPLTDGKDHAFHGMGREDIDALMLGNGRPFVLEIKEPKKRTLDLGELEKVINSSNQGRVEVEDLKPSDGQTVRDIKAAKSQKSYVVHIEMDIEPDEEKVYKVANDFRNLSIKQQTPNRVSHRRADLIRTREVFTFEIKELDGTKASIEIKGESGLYIKELIHGDDGRTEPNFAGSIGIPCKVLALDVVHIWDKKMEE